MAERLSSVPLFPLATVLFPHAAIYLHVFEPRYREMIARCQETGNPFGVVLLRDGTEGGSDQEPYMVGTRARIHEVHTYPDGRLDVHAHGEDRFRIRALDRDAAPYLVGRAEPLYEEEWDDGDEANSLLDHARNRFEDLVRTVLAGRSFDVRVDFPEDPVTLSFAIANLIEMEPLAKQRLLETTDTLERLAEIVPELENQIARTQSIRSEAEVEIRPLTLEDVRPDIFPN